MTTAERIQEIIRRKGLNVKTFSELCGYDRPQAFYDLLKGKTRNVSDAMCANILSAFPEINRTWLLTGDGEMEHTSSAIANGESGTLIKQVPLVPIAAIAGPLAAYYESGVHLSQCRMINSPTQLAEIALTVSGDSMEPLFTDGSTIFIRRINGEAFIPWGHPLVLDTENGVFIKNIMPDEANDYYIWAESVNPRYPRMHVPKSSIMSMFRVVASLKSFATM